MPQLRGGLRVSLLALFALLIALLGLGAPTAFAQDVLPVPALSGRVIDQTATLSEPQRAALTAKLEALEQGTGSQLVVLVVPTTQPEDIASYSQRVADQWKLGRRDVGDGLLIIVAKGDRKVRIEIAKTLEGAIPDLMAKRVISERISPAFKAGDYAGGLNAAVDQLSALVRGEALPAPKTRNAPAGGGAGVQWEELAMFFFIGVPIIGVVLTGMFGRKLGSLLTGGAAGGIGWALTASALLAGAAGLVALVLVGILGIGSARRSSGRSGLGGGPVIWGGGGGGWGSGGGGGGGGGFSSGGGGDFGGGGASGDW